MGFLDTMRTWIGAGPEEPDEEMNQSAEQEQEVAQEPARSVPAGIHPIREARAEERKGRANAMQNNGSQVVLLCPTSFEDASAIADHLCQQHTVVLNLERADLEVTRRLVDFLSGVAYANKGMIRRVAKQTFMITPQGIEAVGELTEADEFSSDPNATF